MQHKIFLSIILSTLLLVGCSEKNTDELILEANEYIQSNNDRAAVVTLKNAVTLDTQNQNIRILLGQLYLKMGLYVNAEKELRRAIDLGASEVIVIPLLVKSFYYQELLDQVVVSALSFKTDDEQARSKVNLYAYIAQLKTANQPNLDKEVVTLNSLIGDDLLLAKAYDLYIKNQSQDAFNLLDRRTSESDKLEVMLLTGLLYASQKKYSDSIKAYEEVIALAPLNYITKYQIAEVYIKNNQLDDAELYVDELLNMNTEGAYANLLKAQIAFRRDQHEVAFSSASKATQNGLDRPLTNLIAGISAYKLKNFESAYQYLTKVSEQLPPNHYANRVLVEVRLKLGAIDNIEELLEGFTANSEDTSNLFAIAAMNKFQQGNISEAINFFEKSNTLNPDNALNLVREGLAKISMQDYQGIESLKKAVGLDNTLDQAWALLAHAYMQKNDSESAFEIVKQWQEINKVEGENLEAYLHLQLGNNREARAILEPLAGSRPEHFSALRLLMLLTAREKKFDDARPLAEKLVKLDNKNLQSYFALVNISVAQGKSEEIENQLLNALDDSLSVEQSMVIKIALGKLYNYKNKPMLTTKLGWDISSLSNDDALSVLGEAYLILKDYASAYKIYNSWLGERINNKYPWIKILELFEQSREYKMGLKAALKAADIFTNDDVIQTYIVMFQIKNGLVKPAEKQLTQIALRNPNLPTLDLLYGELALKNNQLEIAQKKLMQFYTKHPSLNTAILLAEALIRQNKLSDAVSYLDSELEKTPYKTIKDTHYVAELYSEHGLYSNAVKHYQSLLELQTQDVVTLNNYASVLLKMGRYEDALPIAYRALKLMPTSPFVLDTVGWAAFKNGQVNESVTYLSNAYKSLPNHTEVQLHFIEILIVDGQMDKAKLIINRCKPSSSGQQSQLERLKAMI